MNFEGEKDIRAAAIRLQDIDEEIRQLRAERDEVEEWLYDTMPADKVETDVGRLVRGKYRRWSGWNNEAFRQDALRASAVEDGQTEQWASPTTGEVRHLPVAAYQKGWEAAHRLVTLSGDRAKSTAKKKLGLDDRFYATSEWRTFVKVEHTL